MITENYILNEQLPVTQDFRSLKNEGLAYIQQVSGNEWTNLNPSDPGVTILDQLCFALTELGYCADFSVADILTDHNEKLQIRDQFYVPEEILTSSPITVDDYKKFIIDSVTEVENMIILPQKNDCSFIKGSYSVYLLIDPSIQSTGEIIKICRSVFYRLNKRRNLGEIFMMPLPLQPISHTLKGQLEITDARDAGKILTLIQNKIRNYIFPKISQTSYEQLIEDGLAPDEIFNGPALQHGWVPKHAIGKKNDTIRIRDLIHLIQSVKGVVSISNLSIENSEPGVDIQCSKTQILIFDLSGLQVKSKAMATAGTNALNSPLQTIDYKELETNSSFGASEALQPKLPKGKYRDINNYYSIQNTFPEIFAVGANAINSHASDFKIAQSRQLKGYLTLFDQVLANQFSQLANVPQLFSFKNAMCGNPSDRKEFYSLKDQFEKQRPEYPVPYLTFSPTYFYQSLYKIPNIQPLLKDKDMFRFGLDLESKKELRQTGWEEYKQDPYNKYIKGLMNFMEDENTNLDRRNDMLDHLLARHGESPLMINAIIDGSQYSGDSLKDRIIFKSLFLQNLGTLSYFRQKGYNYLGAGKISPLVETLPEHLEEKLKEGSLKSSSLESDNSVWIEKEEKQSSDTYSKDFIFNSAKVDRIEKIKKIDYINYSALELKLNLLFGLRVQYTNYIFENLDLLDEKKCDTCTEKPNNPICKECDQYVHNIKLALWLMQERKGFILIENCLLQSADFEIIITKSMETGPYYKINKQLSYTEAMEISFMLRSVPEIEFIEQKDTKTPSALIPAIKIGKELSYQLTVIANSNTGNNWTESTGGDPHVYFSFNKSADTGTGMSPDNILELIFPDFIPQFNTTAFKDRLDLFLTNTLPVEISYKLHFVSAEKLTGMIPTYVDWHNSLIYNNLNPKHAELLTERSDTLISLLNSIDIKTND